MCTLCSLRSLYGGCRNATERRLFILLIYEAIIACYYGAMIRQRLYEGLASIGHEGLRVDREACEANESNAYTEQVAIAGAIVLRLANFIKPNVTELASD